MSFFFFFFQHESYKVKTGVHVFEKCYNSLKSLYKKLCAYIFVILPWLIVLLSKKGQKNGSNFFFHNFGMLQKQSPRGVLEKMILKYFWKFTGKDLYLSIFGMFHKKVADLFIEYLWMATSEVSNKKEGL